MSPLLPRCAAILMAASALVASTHAADDLASTFNGKDLTGWKVPGTEAFWKVVDGVLVGENDAKLTGNMLYTEKAYHDVIFEAEVRWNGIVDTGIMVRKPEIQAQIGTSGSLKRDMTCSFYVGGYPEAGQAKTAAQFLKLGDWNRIRIQAKGDTFTTWLNGEQVSQYTDAKYAAPGPIGLQIHPGKAMKVEFRNLRVKALD